MTAKNSPPADEKATPPLADVIASILQKVWRWHSYMLAGLAVALATVAYFIFPSPEQNQRQPLATYFDDSILPAIRRAQNPLSEIDNESLWQQLVRARSDVEYVFGTSPYKEEVEVNPLLINPYLLFGEMFFICGEIPSLSQDRAAAFERAVWGYGRALTWENKDWDEREQKVYDRQFFATGEEFDEQILQTRKNLRREYIEYKLARAAIETGQLNLADEKLNNVLQNPAAAGLPPHEFEMLPEDRVNLNFYLGQVAERRNDIAEAERRYRIFLLSARRSDEYFRALLQLGNFSFRQAHNVMKTNPDEARRLYHDATTIFSRIVADSPAGDVLRSAYFVGGRAFYNMALTIPVETATYWDRANSAGETLKNALEKFSGAALPARTAALPAAVSRLVGAAGVTAIDPFSAYVEGGVGTLAALSTKHRLTRNGERARLLRRAADFFVGSQGGAAQLYDGAANVMLARILLAQNNFDEARKMLLRTTRNFAAPEIADACRFEEAVSYLREKQYDRAFTRIVGGPEKTNDSLLAVADFKSWPQFCVDLLENLLSPPPQPAVQIWTALPVEAQNVARATSVSKIFPDRFQPIFTKNLNAALSREDFYSPVNFAKLETPAAARRLLEGDISLLTLSNRQWLNRMSLDAACRATIMPTGEGEILPMFPAAKEIRPGELLTPEMVKDAVQELSRAYLQLAEHPEPINPDDDEATLRLKAATPRRQLLQVYQLNNYLLQNYRDEDTVGEMMYENARLLTRSALLAAEMPFKNYASAREFLNKSGAAFVEVTKNEKLSDSEVASESLREAGKNFYAAGNYGQASEALAAFVHISNRSDHIGWASNLLGRCYWYLGRYLEAIRVYRENAIRRTPDGYESLYYLGAVYFDVRQTRDERDDKVFIDRLGDPAQPFAPVTIDGRMETPYSALQVFNEIRRMSGLEPSSRPWRWATFGLGRVWYEIAERARNNEIALAQQENRRAVQVKWLPHYENAERILRESLDRYRLATDAAPNAAGIRQDREPEDFEDTRRLRLESEYYLALTLRELLMDRPDNDESEMRQLFANILDPSQYPPAVFSSFRDENLLLKGDALLGVTNGPMVRSRYLEALRRNAFFLLAQSYKQLAKKIGRANIDQITRSNRALEDALSVYRRARDSLPATDSPQVYFNIGDTLYDLGENESAGRMFLLVVSQVEQMETIEQNPDVLADIRIWKTLAQNRLRDLTDRGNK